MGKVKEWAFTHQECAACGSNFLPWLVEHKINDLRLPTCSQQCEDETIQLFETIAATQRIEDDERRQRDNKTNNQ